MPRRTNSGLASAVTLKRYRHQKMIGYESLQLPIRSTISIFVFLLATSVCAQEWTRFRGLNGSGYSSATTIPTSWKLDDANWRVKLPGKGHSSPVLWGDRIFLTSCDEATKERIIMCRDVKDGHELWTRRYSTTLHRKHQLNSYASATPVVDAKRLYLCWATATDLVATAFDHQGHEVWQSKIGTFKSSHGYGMSPIVYGNLLIVASDQQGDSSLIALDKKNGSIRWQVARDTKVTYSTPCVLSRKGHPDELIFTNWSHGITSVDPGNGRINWELGVFQQKSFETAIGSPIVNGDLILGTCGYLGRGIHTVAVRRDDSISENATEVYRLKRGVPLTTTPVIGNGFVFLWSDNGIATCADARDGKVHWQKRIGGTFYSSPIVVDKHVYCVSTDGDAIVVAADKKFRFIAKIPLGEPSHSTPAIAGGRMYLRTFSSLISIGGKQ